MLLNTVGNLHNASSTSCKTHQNLAGDKLRHKSYSGQ